MLLFPSHTLYETRYKNMYEFQYISSSQFLHKADIISLPFLQLPSLSAAHQDSLPFPFCKLQTNEVFILEN